MKWVFEHQDSKRFGPKLNYSRIHNNRGELISAISQSTNFYEVLHTLFSIDVVTTLKVSRSFDKYLS